jgi:YggT family protein
MFDTTQGFVLYLIVTIVDLYLFVLAIRFVLAWERANYFNPVTQFIIKLTQPIVAPVRKLIPTQAGIEFSTLAWLIVISAIKFFIILSFSTSLPNGLGILILAIADILKTFAKLIFYAIFLQAILSWFQPTNTPALQVLNQITQPILRPLRRFIPPVSMLDLTAFFALILLQIVDIFILSGLTNFGYQIAIGH